MPNKKKSQGGDSKPSLPKPTFLTDETRDDPFSPTGPFHSSSSSPRLSLDSTNVIPNPFSDPNSAIYGNAHTGEYSPSGPVDYFSRPILSDSSPPATPIVMPGQSINHFPYLHAQVPSIGHMQELPRGSFRGSTHSSNNSIREAFTPPPTRPITASTYSTGVKVHRTRLRSTMLKEDTVYKPWLEKKDNYGRIVHVLTYGVMFLGVVGSFFICFFGWRSVPVIDNKNLCQVMDENWQGSDEDLFGANGRWMREVQMDGFGNGEFEMTTSSSNNSFIKDGNLYIVPTLTADVIGSDAIYDGYTYNITDCSYNSTTDPNAFNAQAYLKSCSAVSNSTSGSVINPIQSARLSTRRSASIRYGKVEVRAKLPRGDWLWPAIWMLPTDNAYGPWPASGEIDIMEARGNSPRYPLYGYNVARGSLHWGPMATLNRVWMTYGLWRLRHTTFADDFHTYTLEWTPEFLRVYVDTRLHHMLDLRFNIPFFQRGNFPTVVQNGSDYISLQNPWANGAKSAPFDQKFYLILNLAVGGTNGWFPNGLGGKPWLDESQNAMRDFAKGQDQWYPTWPENEEDRALVVQSVKMWELC